MAFAIVADLPLGTYRGAGPDGRPEPVPSVARLHSALLCAAGFGPRAVEAGPGALDLADADAAALRWLEANPPDSVHIPALEVSPGGPVAYRDDGTLTKAPQPGKLTTRKLAKAPNAGSAVNGQFMWIWQQEPPEPVRDVLAQLCPDVPYLGTTESPVRLTAVSGSGLRSTHDLRPGAGLFTVAGIGIDRPVAGRVDELSQAHREASATPAPAAKDKHKTGEDSRSAVPPRKSVETAWYCPRLPDAPDVPWSQVIAIPVDAPVPAKARVAWAVAAHRALTKIAGDGAPAVITGSYAAGVRRPANRIALHMLDAATGAEAPGPCLLVMVPAGTEPADLGVLQRAVMQLSVLRGPQGKARRLDTSQIRVLDGSRFWSPPAPGAIRLWRTVPAAVPETRGPRGGEWNFAHAALLSLGFVWKDQHRLARVQGRGDAYHRGLAAAVSEAGVAVVHTKAVRTGDVDRYVHKVNEHAVVRPYTACLSLGSLAGPGTILAIGQSRHLGGGLLIPLDVPEGAAVTDIRLPHEGGA